MSQMIQHNPKIRYKIVIVDFNAKMNKELYRPTIGIHSKHFLILKNNDVHFS